MYKKCFRVTKRYTLPTLTYKINSFGKGDLEHKKIYRYVKSAYSSERLVQIFSMTVFLSTIALQA